MSESVVSSTRELESVHAVPRRAEPRDLPALLALKAAVVDDVLGSKYSSKSLKLWKERFVSGEYFAGRLESSSRPTTFFITGSRRRPAGMVALKERDGVAYIGDLYVRKRGHGLGRRLLRHALTTARNRGFKIAVADVFDDAETALSLFQAEGFKEHDQYLEPSLGIKVHRLALELVRLERAGPGATSIDLVSRSNDTSS